MTDAATFKDHSAKAKGIEGVSSEDRTKVIVLSQVVAIVALLVLWSIIRAKRAAKADA